jgi:archaellin
LKINDKYNLDRSKSQKQSEIFVTVDSTSSREDITLDPTRNTNSSNDKSTTTKYSSKGFSKSTNSKDHFITSIITNSKPYQGTCVEKYLSKRGITKTSKDTYFYEYDYYGEHFFAQINLMKDEKGIVQGVHKILLTSKGEKLKEPSLLYKNNWKEATIKREIKLCSKEIVK